MKRRISGWVLATTVLLVSACGGGTDGSDTVETTVETTPTTAGAAAEETTTIAETTTAPETTQAPDTTRSDPYDYGGSGDSTTSSSSSTSTTAPSDGGGGTSLVVAEGEMGSYLTTGDGFSVYLFTQDEQGESTCYDDCEGSWPPVTGEITAGEGVDASLLGTTTREDGSEQVTYNDWPLYYFANDAEPGDTNGQGVGDVWYLVTPEGEQLP